MRGISKLNGIILIAVFLVLMFMVYNLNLLPFKYFLIAGSVLSLFVLLFVFKLVRKKTGVFSRILFNIFSIGMICGFIYIISYINATNNFLNNMVAKNFEVVTYDVIVNKTSNYNSIGDLYNKDIAHISSDSNYNLLKFKLRSDIKYVERQYKSVDLFESSIENGDIAALVLPDSYYEMLKEEYSNLESSTKVIKKYKIIVKRDKKSDNKVLSKSPFLLYISGIDTYGKISSVSRSDVNILMAVNPTKEKILLVSIPRDYYVLIPEKRAKDKLTHAGIYGIDTSISTINNLLDTKIDYYLRINFSTLTKSIDLIDGVDIYSDRTFNPTSNPNITINKGMNHMNGDMALAFARERYTYTQGDRRRGENQQAIITEMINKMTDTKYVMKYKKILNSLDGSFETSMGQKQITDLFKMQMERKINWKTESISLDGIGGYNITYSMGSRRLYVMEPNVESVNNAKVVLNNYLEKEKSNGKYKR